ncbi:MAG: accessory gene regulator B family protein [Clostridiales bacterium]|nr:accessory gene regulator B family protein [Clostridiales bacterium]
MHSIANMLAKKLINSSSYQGQIDVIAYGLEIILNITVQVFIFFLIGTLLHVVPEMLAVVIPTLFYRYLSGGTHCSTFLCCTVNSSVIFTVISYCTHVYGENLIAFLPALFVSSLFATLVWAPVNPRMTSVKAKRYKLYSIIFILLMFFISHISFNNSLKPAIALGLAWQAFSISPMGIWIIRKLDFYFH